MKRGSADVWWIIIGAVIALVAVVVLLTIFVGKSQEAGTGFSSCEAKAGLCITGDFCPKNTIRSDSFECASGVQNCCLGLPVECTPESGCTNCIEANGKQWCP